LSPVRDTEFGVEIYKTLKCRLFSEVYEHLYSLKAEVNTIQYYNKPK